MEANTCSDKDKEKVVAIVSYELVELEDLIDKLLRIACEQPGAKCRYDITFE